MAIRNAQFIKSESSVDTHDTSDTKEFAFIGRSNVGKSSLINALTNNNKLAKVSSTPGKTRLINKFSINDGEWTLVDLPGYGYAKMSHKDTEELNRIINSYILKSRQLFLLCVLIDIRLAPQKNDISFIEKLAENEIPFVLVFTKADKLSSAAAKKSVENYKKFLSQSWEELPQIFVTSSKNCTGTIELISFIENLL